MVLLKSLIEKETLDASKRSGVLSVEDCVLATTKENHAFLGKLTSASPRIPATRSCLFVVQGEYALCQGRPRFEVVGSEDATTCVILVIVGENGMVYTSHVDESTCMDSSLQTALMRCTGNGATPARVYIAGGYGDDGMVSASVVFNLLKSSYGLEHLVHLELCCVGQVNTDDRGFPRTRALAVDLVACEALPFTFEYRGPEISRRHAQRSMLPGDGLCPVVTMEGDLVLPQMRVVLLRTAKNFYLKLLRLASDDPQGFLHECSTSPLHESDMFLPDMVEMMQFMIEQNGTMLAESGYRMHNRRWGPLPST